MPYWLKGLTYARERNEETMKLTPLVLFVMTLSAVFFGFNNVNAQNGRVGANQGNSRVSTSCVALYARLREEAQGSGFSGKVKVLGNGSRIPDKTPEQEGKDREFFEKFGPE